MKDLVELFQNPERSTSCNAERNERTFHNYKLSSKANNSWDMIDDQVNTSNELPDNVIQITGFKATKEQRQKMATLRKDHNRKVA